MKKNVLVILFILVIFCGLCISSCSNTNKETIDSVKQVEMLDMKFSCMYDIYYDEYMSNIAQYFTSNYDQTKHISRNFILPVEKVEFDTMINLRKEAEIKNNNKDFLKYSIETSVSKVYDYKGIKLVFTKAKYTDNHGEFPIQYCTKKYCLVEENSEWKIQCIEKRFYNAPLTKTMEFETFNKEPVEYTIKFEHFK